MLVRENFYRGITTRPYAESRCVGRVPGAPNPVLSQQNGKILPSGGPKAAVAPILWPTRPGPQNSAAPAVLLEGPDSCDPVLAVVRPWLLRIAFVLYDPLGRGRAFGSVARIFGRGAFAAAGAAGALLLSRRK